MSYFRIISFIAGAWSIAKMFEANDPRVGGATGHKKGKNS
jgi:hypothetical protein